MGGIISSGVVKDWPASYSLSELNSGWLGQHALMHSSFVEENNSTELISKNASLLDSNESLSPQFDEESLKNSKKRFNQVNNYTSFIEMGETSSAKWRRHHIYPIFKWIPPSFQHIFKPYTLLTFKNPKIPNLKDYTIIMRFELRSFTKEDTYLFSYPGCGGFNILLRSNGALAIGDLCDSNKLYQPGYQVPLDDPVTLYFRFKYSKVRLHIQSEKVKFPFAKDAIISLPLEKFDTCAIGSLANKKGKGPFLGKIRYFFIFRGEYSLSDVPSLIRHADIKEHGVQELKNTVDKRMCVSPCTDNPIPPSPQAGNPPKEADINGDSDDGSTTVRKESKETITQIGGAFRGAIGAFGEVGAKSGTNGFKGFRFARVASGDASGEISGRVSGSASKDATSGIEKGVADVASERQAVGTFDTFRFARVTSRGRATSGGIVGAGAHLNNSPGSTGTYDKKQKNNIETNKIDCHTTIIHSKLTGGPGKFFRVHCPDCTKIGNGMVFGTANFHPRSSICKAALHSGALKPGSSGSIIVTLAGPKPSFNG